MSAAEISAEDLFTGGGETGRVMAGLDWASTDLGPVSGWPQSLRATVRIVLSSRYPMLLLWGPRYTQLYNDAYSALIGNRHPAALGNDVRVTLAEGWDVLEPLIADAMATGVASWVPALQLLLDRAGYREEAYFSVSHAPARDDAGDTVGVLTVCSEVTDQVIGERRLRLLRDLSLPDAPGDVDQICVRLCEVLGEHPLDVPFAAIYLREGDVLRRVATTGATPEAALPEAIGPHDAEDIWHLRATAGGGTGRRDDVADQIVVPAGPWDDPVRTAVAYPLPSADQGRPVGAIVAGVSPSKALDETYGAFFQLLAQQIAVAVRNAKAYQEERERAAALAELDRVKTDFFTNVSHEFRTPLTLLLGPLADALADADEPLGEAQRTRIETATGNADRLLGLVNNLLTFSSLEAGRPANAPRVVDLARLTADLAGVFRAAVERAGLRLTVDCPPTPRPVAVDPVNWEKIVTNLLSNALKFTFVGEIRVSLHADDQGVALEVSDTGIGVAADEVPHLFDRFHRVRDARSRSHEGSGIGLALVRELTRLLGGDVDVESTPARGTTFTVRLPWAAIDPGRAAAPGPDGDVAGLATARSAARQAAGWMTAPDEEPVPAGDGERILVADDNSDMRAYVSRLLAEQGWVVRTAADGVSALEMIRADPPDLLLTDVMMPRLDGFALTRAVRAEPATRTLPVVMLSARAGQESGVEGLSAGADDYVVKPFTAAELVARVRSTLRLARLRSTHTRQLSALAGTAAVIASGRVLEDAIQAVTEQALLFVDGVAAVTELDGGDRRAPLRFSASAEPGPDIRTDGPWVRAAIEGRDGSRIGELAVQLDRGHRIAGEVDDLLAPMTGMLASLAQSRWQLEHERQMVLTVQQSLLPESLPTVQGWDLEGMYRPAAGHIGGDWYDVLALPGGELLVSIGDVAGHGLGAAVATGQIRNAVRAYAVEDAAPARVVDRVAALLGGLRTAVTATLFVLRLDPATGAFSWCTAGHPAPVLSGPELTADVLTGLIGPPLGLRGASYRQNEGTVPPGGQLLLYTDGLVEEFPASIDVGFKRLKRRCAVAQSNRTAPAAFLDTVASDVREPQHDDIAAVFLRRRGDLPAPVSAGLAEVDVTWTYPLSPSASAAARRDLRGALGDDRIDEDLLQDLQVAATEAVNNAVEHAQRPTRPEVQMHLRVSDGLVRIVVRDFGGWRARPPSRDRGRGALLMNAYGDVRVTATATGTTVTIERRWAPAAGPKHPEGE